MRTRRRLAIAAWLVLALTGCASLPPGSSQPMTSLRVDLHAGYTRTVSVGVRCESGPVKIHRQVRDGQHLAVPACGRVFLGVFLGQDLVWRAEHQFDPGMAYRIQITQPPVHTNVLHTA